MFAISKIFELSYSSDENLFVNCGSSVPFRIFSGFEQKKVVKIQKWEFLRAKIVKNWQNLTKSNKTTRLSCVSVRHAAENGGPTLSWKFQILREKWIFGDFVAENPQKPALKKRFVWQVASVQRALTEWVGIHPQRMNSPVSRIFRKNPPFSVTFWIETSFLWRFFFFFSPNFSEIYVFLDTVKLLKIKTT